jgi:hypothetical protein
VRPRGLKPVLIVALRGAEAPLFHGIAGIRGVALRGLVAGSCGRFRWCRRQQVPRLRKIIRFADDLAALGMTMFCDLALLGMTTFC